MSAPCDWPIDFADCATPPGWEGSHPSENGEPSDRERFTEMAAALLWNWTGRVFGVCEATIRPCRTGCGYSRGSTYEGGLRTGFQPALIGGRWYNLSCGDCLNVPCSCSLTDSPRALILPGPVQEITEIVIGGEPLDENAYRVERKRVLVRTDGGVWQGCQNLLNDKDDEGSWYITYKRGVPVPIGGQLAAGRLAVELYKAFCGDSDCALPDRVQSVTRQGVSVDIMQTEFEAYQAGQTGIWSVDSWVASITTPQARSARVLSPDLMRGRR